jgi:hypothetical protein
MTMTAISPETANVPADSEAARRAAHIAGLRRLATTLEAHPGLPLPWEGSHAPLTFHFLSGDARANLAAAARALPCASWAKGTREYGELGGSYFDLHGEVLGLKVMLIADRETVCERVVTGKREVTEMLPDPDLIAAIPLVPVTREEDIVEWTCGSVLAPAQDGDQAA